MLEGKHVYVEFAGNLVPVTKSGEQLRLVVRAFKENRLPFTMRVKDPNANPHSWTIIMKEPKVCNCINKVNNIKFTSFTVYLFIGVKGFQKRTGTKPRLCFGIRIT